MLDNALQRKIAELMVDGMTLSEIIASLERVQWDNWTEEIKQYRNRTIANALSTVPLFRICQYCQHNFEPHEGQMSNMGWICHTCDKARHEAYENELIPCKECKKGFPRKQTRMSPEVSKWIHGFVCSDCIEIALDRVKIHCIVCDTRFLCPSTLSGGFPRSHINKSERLGRTGICSVCNADTRIIKEYGRVRQQIARAEEAHVSATLTIRQWLATLEYFGWKCAYCSHAFDGLEHYIPITLHGGTTVDNCLPTCYRCNIRKSNKSPEKFASLFPAENIARIKAYFASLELAETA